MINTHAISEEKKLAGDRPKIFINTGRLNEYKHDIRKRCNEPAILVSLQLSEAR